MIVGIVISSVMGLLLATSAEAKCGFLRYQLQVDVRSSLTGERLSDIHLSASANGSASEMSRVPAENELPSARDDGRARTYLFNTYSGPGLLSADRCNARVKTLDVVLTHPDYYTRRVTIRPVPVRSRAGVQTIVIPLLVMSSHQSSTPKSIAPAHDRVVQRWLETHKDLRRARLDDCEDSVVDSTGKKEVDSCDRLLRTAREWTKDPATELYYAKGDFNGDGEEDFAVVLTAARAGKNDPKPATVAVFNGPFQIDAVVNPAFSMATGRSVSQVVIGYGSPRPKPWHLIIGAPESEGAALVWRKGTYVLR